MQCLESSCLKEKKNIKNEINFFSITDILTDQVDQTYGIQERW